MSTDISEEKLERIADSADRIANDGYNLFRLNLIIIGIILSASAFLAQSASSDVAVNILQSYYTIASIALLIMSSMVGFFAYEPARRLSAMWMYDDPEGLVKRHASIARLSFNVRYGMFFSLVSVFSFGIGVFDGYIPIGVDLMIVLQTVFILFLIAVAPMIAIVGIRKTRNRLDGYNLPW